MLLSSLREQLDDDAIAAAAADGARLIGDEAIDECVDFSASRNRGFAAKCPKGGAGNVQVVRGPMDNLGGQQFYHPRNYRWSQICASRRVGLFSEQVNAVAFDRHWVVVTETIKGLV